MGNKRIARFIAERDAVLLSGNVEAVMRFLNRSRTTDKMIDYDKAEAAMHKARTACRTLPIEARQASKAWLDARGMHSLDDGEL